MGDRHRHLSGRDVPAVDRQDTRRVVSGPQVGSFRCLRFVDFTGSSSKMTSRIMPRHISTPSTLKPKPKLQLTSTNMLRSGAAVILALATLGSCFVAGSRVWPRQPAHAALFAAAIMASFGAHAAGHYVA